MIIFQRLDIIRSLGPLETQNTMREYNTHAWQANSLVYHIIQGQSLLYYSNLMGKREWFFWWSLAVGTI